MKPCHQRRLGLCFTLTRELEIEDAHQFPNLVRMNAVQFQQVIQLVIPKFFEKLKKGYFSFKLVKI